MFFKECFGRAKNDLRCKSCLTTSQRESPCLDTRDKQLNIILFTHDQILSCCCAQNTCTMSARNNYIVAMEAKGIIKTEKLANPCSISLANPTFTFSLVVWDKFCGQGTKNTSSTSTRNIAAPGRMKIHCKNREPGKSLKAVSWASNSKLLFPTKQDFLFIFSIIFQSLFLNINCRTSVPNGPHIVWQRAIKNIFLLWNNFLPYMYQALI